MNNCCSLGQRIDDSDLQLNVCLSLPYIRQTLQLLTTGQYVLESRVAYSKSNCTVDNMKESGITLICTLWKTLKYTKHSLKYYQSPVHVDF